MARSKAHMAYRRGFILGWMDACKRHIYFNLHGGTVGLGYDDGYAYGRTCHHRYLLNCTERVMRPYTFTILRKRVERTELTEAQRIAISVEANQAEAKAGVYHDGRRWRYRTPEGSTMPFTPSSLATDRDV